MLLESVESLLNRNIAASQAARRLCRQLDGRVLSIHILGTPVEFVVQMRPTGERIALRLTREGPSDASIHGTPLGLAGLAGRRSETVLRKGFVRIEGDAEVAQAFRELLAAATPDLEEELARLSGDVAAHRLGTLAREMAAFGRRSAGTFARNVAEYLQEETRDLPTRIEVEEFIGAVDDLRDDVERAAARLERIERSAAAR